MARTCKRDDKMYPFEKQHLVDIARKIKKKSIDFNDYIPNHLERSIPEPRQPLQPTMNMSQLTE